jgi:hypothetical protein
VLFLGVFCGVCVILNLPAGVPANLLGPCWFRGGPRGGGGGGWNTLLN